MSLEIKLSIAVMVNNKCNNSQRGLVFNICVAYGSWVDALQFRAIKGALKLQCHRGLRCVGIAFIIGAFHVW